ncbi:MAG TPA: ABC transporter permease [Stellaceae bacterium]|nr:ABC transporter permease [Stellaceae bacterium]
MDFVTVAQTVFSSLANGTLYAFIGLGFGLVNRSTGVINFAQGDFVMLGAILTAVLSRAGLPVGLSAAIAVIACAVVGGAFYQLALRPARRASTGQLVLITIGFSIFLRGAVTTLWGSDPMPVPSFTGSRPLDVIGVSMLPQELWLIAMLVIVSLLTAGFFQRTVIGLALRAAASNPLGAAFVGIDHRRMGFYAFVAAGMLGGLGGAVWSPISLAQVDIGVGLGLKGFTAAALGGFSTASGPIAGGLLLGLAEGFGAGFVSSAYQDAITFTLLLVVLIARPQGLFGTVQRATADERQEAGPSTGVSATRLSAADFWRLGLGAVALLVLGQVLVGIWLTAAIFALDLAIVAMGLVLLTGYAGQLSLGQGAFMMIGAYSSGYLTVVWGWPPVAALAVGVVLATVMALLLGRVIFRLRGYYLSMASLGLLMIALTFARETALITGGPNGLPGIPPFSFVGYRFFSDRPFYYLALAVSLVIVALALSLTRSRFGRALLAIRSNESAARSCAVDAVAHKMRSFAFSAAAASVAGSLYVHYLGIANPIPFGIDATIAQLTALTLGGFQSLWGTYFGAAVVVALPAAIGWVGGSSATQFVAGLQYLIFGLLLICVVVVQSSDQGLRFLAALGSWRRLGRPAPEAAAP